jgi:hypothetical protein
MARPEATSPSLPGKLLAELETAARAEDRPVGEVLAEAVRKYLDERVWQRLIQSGRERATELGLTEEDIPRLIADSRSDQGKER